MGKKSFANGLNTLLGPSTSAEEVDEPTDEVVTEIRERGRPRTNMRQITKTSQIGTREGETRSTFIMNEKALERLKALSYWKRKQIKTVLQEALDSYFKGYSSDEIRKAEEMYQRRDET